MLEDKFITVHGTNDGDVLVSRVKWWQNRSPFERALFKHLGIENHAEGFEEFKWSGANSERERRRAAKELFKRVRSLEEAGAPYHLIGHSHGGSVIAETVLLASHKRLKLEHLRSCTTVGTPFIDFAFQSLSSLKVARILRSLWIVFLIFAASLAWLWFVSGHPAWDLRMEDLKLGSGDMLKTTRVAVGIAALAGLLLTGPIVALQTVRSFFPGARNRHRRADFRRAKQARECWQGLWDRNDEAIGALGAARHFRMSLFRGWRVSGLSQLGMNLSSFILILVLFVDGTAVIIAFSIYMLLVSRDFLMRSYGWEDWAVGLLSDNETLIEWILVLGVVAPVVALALALIFGTLFGMSRYVIDPIFRVSGAKWLDRVAAGQLRREAYGWDVSGESVRGVAPSPWFAEKSWSPLPNAIHDELVGLVENAAARTVNKVRDMLGSAYVSGRRLDVLADISSQLEWDELIHTSYFDVPRFTKLLALGISRLAGGSQSSPLKSDPDYQQLVHWLEGMRAGVQDQPREA